MCVRRLLTGRGVLHHAPEGAAVCSKSSDATPLRADARHVQSLPAEELVKCAETSLKAQGNVLKMVAWARAIGYLAPMLLENLRASPHAILDRLEYGPSCLAFFGTD